MLPFHWTIVTESLSLDIAVYTEVYTYDIIQARRWWPSRIRQTTITHFSLEIAQQIHMQLADKSPQVMIVPKKCAQ